MLPPCEFEKTHAAENLLLLFAIAKCHVISLSASNLEEDPKVEILAFTNIIFTDPN